MNTFQRRLVTFLLVQLCCLIQEGSRRLRMASQPADFSKREKCTSLTFREIHFSSEMDRLLG